MPRFFALLACLALLLLTSGAVRVGLALGLVVALALAGWVAAAFLAMLLGPRRSSAARRRS